MTNVVPGVGDNGKVSLQNTLSKWFKLHNFTVEVTTTPQSLHDLILQATGSIGLLRSRSRLVVTNPLNVNSNPTIYACPAPVTGPDHPGKPGYVSTGKELALWAWGPGGMLDEKLGANIDILIWCATGTAAIVVSELG